MKHRSETELKRASRRQALQSAAAWAASAIGTSTSLGACGGSGSSGSGPEEIPPPPIQPPPPAPTSLERLKAALLTAQTPTIRATPMGVSQGTSNSAAPALGSSAVILPTPLGASVNPNPVTLANLDQVWGFARQTWFRRGADYYGTSPNNSSWFVPMAVVHPSATANAGGFCGLHFNFTGRSFEVLFGGADVYVTLMVDGQYATPRYISTQLAGGQLGAPLNQQNTYVQFDLGSQASRKISLYARSSLGLCAIAFGAEDSVSAWDRSSEPTMNGMADSYGQSFSANWAGMGIFCEAAFELGIPHVDINAIGGTGYAQNNVTTNAGDTFGARIASVTQVRTDLFLTAGGVNDNNWLALFPYATADAARTGFDAAVRRYFLDLRAALPGTVLAATGPWQPNEANYAQQALQKVDSIRDALAAVDGPWIFMDNLRGSWVNSAGAHSTAATGPWQTGSGTVANPKGDGNGDLYVSADGTHPSDAGSSYLARQIAQFLRAGLLAL